LSKDNGSAYADIEPQTWPKLKSKERRRADRRDIYIDKQPSHEDNRWGWGAAGALTGGALGGPAGFVIGGILGALFGDGIDLE